MVTICLATAIINMTLTLFDQQDHNALRRAMYLCENDDRYAGCLERFEKREQGVYRAICGEPRPFDRKAFDKAELSAIMKELDHLPEDIKREKLKQIGVEL